MLSTTSLTATQINISVNDIDTKRGGDIRVYIFGEDGYPKKHDEALYAQNKKAIESSILFTFEVDNTLKEFAIKLFHDENGDGKVSKNWTGIYPKEGLGFSNDQKLGMFGPPNYKNSKLSRDEFSEVINISIVYP